jgi:hypothetical protein
MEGGSATTNLPCFLCDEKKCNKSCLKTPACQDCTDRLNLTSCRHVAFCHGDAAPVSICQSLVHWSVSGNIYLYMCTHVYDYILIYIHISFILIVYPTKASTKKVCEPFLKLVLPNKTVLKTAELCQIAVDKWISRKKVVLDQG